MIEDLKGDESWRSFRIISEFTEGFEELADIGLAVSIFGSARDKPIDHGTTSPEDCDLITLTDDPREVVAIMKQHREWKKEHIRQAKLEHLRKHFGDEAKEEWLTALTNSAPRTVSSWKNRDR